jgi:hypothetical protein
MSYPPMKCETIPDQGDHNYVEVWVEHDIAQSYSRSVQPRAMKEAKQTLPRRPGVQWELFDVDYDREYEAPDPRRTVSVYMFRVRGARGAA